MKAIFHILERVGTVDETQSYKLKDKALWEFGIVRRMVELMSEHCALHAQCPDKHNAGLQYSPQWNKKCHQCRRGDIPRESDKCWIQYFSEMAEGEQ